MPDLTGNHPFRGRLAFCSNFHPSPIEYEGETYPTAEHAYQAAKSLLPKEREVIRMADSPHKAKMLGKTLKRIRRDWNEGYRVIAMSQIVWLKFKQNPDLAKLLLETGDEKLAEHNKWGDTFWGICNGEGENVLGKILMQTRKFIKLLEGNKIEDPTATTCWWCNSVPFCEHAFDPYNIGGDCLAEK